MEDNILNPSRHVVSYSLLQDVQNLNFCTLNVEIISLVEKTARTIPLPKGGGGNTGILDFMHELGQSSL